jgi:hypothetical protein
VEPSIPADWANHGYHFGGVEWLHRHRPRWLWTRVNRRAIVSTILGLERGYGVTDHSEQPWEAVLERDGHHVSKSPWGPDDEIGRLN